MQFRLLSGPAIEPVSLADAKAHLRVDQTYDDSLIASLIAVARAQVEQETSHAMVHQTWRVAVHRWQTGRRIVLPRTPAVQLIEIRSIASDGQSELVPIADFQLNAHDAPATVEPIHQRAFHFTSGVVQHVEIDYLAGFGSDVSSVPQALKQAILMLVGHLYETREAASTSQQAIAPKGYDDLLRPYKMRRIGG